MADELPPEPTTNPPSNMSTLPEIDSPPAETTANLSVIAILSEKRREKYRKMYDVILSTPQGPHPITVRRFRPSYNLVWPITIPPPPSEPRRASEIYSTAAYKYLARKLITKTPKISNRLKEVKGEAREVVEEKWDEHTTWGDSVDCASISEVEMLREVGIKVRCRELKWTQQLEDEASWFRCFKHSLLCWEWSLVDSDEDDDEVEELDKGEKEIIENGGDGERDKGEWEPYVLEAEDTCLDEEGNEL